MITTRSDSSGVLTLAIRLVVTACIFTLQSAVTASSVRAQRQCDGLSLPGASEARVGGETSTSPAPRKETRRRNRRHDSTLSPRERAVLLALARCRILSFHQLRRAVFPCLSPQRVGQRLHALAAQGWLQIWEDVSRIGGRPRYALPTRRALALGIGVLRAESIGQASDRLASLMQIVPLE